MMGNPNLFPFQDYWWLYATFTGLVLVVLAIDLGLFQREAHEVSFKEAIIWCAVWVSLALAFNYGLYRCALWKLPQDARLIHLPGFDPRAAAHNIALEFLAGYLIEYSLSVDNLFVFIVVFNYFAVPSKYQYRILFYGILGAIFFRGLFIAMGSVLMRYHAVVIIFGMFLIFTGMKMAFSGDKKIEPEKNLVIRLFRRFFPVTAEMRGQRFFVRKGRMIYATPLFVALLFVETTDILFAIDSVPAIFAITREPLVIFTSNVFAILGLRSLYFLLSGAMNLFHFLKYGLAIVLVFVGLKMVWLNELYGGKFPTSISLLVIGSVLAISIALSLIFPQVEDEQSAAAD